VHLLSLIDSLRTVPHRLYTCVVRLPYTVLPPESTQRYPRSPYRLQHSDSAPQFEVNNYCRGWSITGTISRTFCVSPLPRWKRRDRVALCCAILQDELVAVTLGQEKREQKKKKKDTPPPAIYASWLRLFTSFCPSTLRSRPA
jgi:hypothetical protein